MYIRRKVFSTFQDENGEERLFSTTEFIDEDSYLEEALYSDDEEDKPRTKLKYVKSHRGLGRSLLVGELSGAAGGYAGKMAANEADEKGLSDEEILKASKKAGTRWGAGYGAGRGALRGLALANNYNYGLGGLSKAQKAAIIAAGTLSSAGFGALGGRLGASKNTRTRLDERRLIDIDKK